MTDYKYTQQDVEHAFNSTTGETWAQVKKVTGLSVKEVTSDELLSLPIFGWLLERRTNPRASLKEWWTKPMSEVQEFAESIEPGDEAEEILSEEDLPLS